VIALVSVASLVAPFTFLPPPHHVSVNVNNKVSKSNKIIPLEKPLHQVKLPNFAAIKDIKAKKKAFFDYIRPAVITENKRILSIRNYLSKALTVVEKGAVITHEQQVTIDKLSKKYKVQASNVEDKIHQLLDKIDIVPAELVLAQAANESAWGTSRFAKIGLNFFGIWCYKPNCGMVPNSRNDGAIHEVEAFATVEDAVKKYFYNINTNKAYLTFREIRANLRHHHEPITAEIMVSGLLPYSSRGADYVIEISNMIRHNKKYFGLTPEQEIY
jgi:Bax protein